jgi:hypothetical protein
MYCVFLSGCFCCSTRPPSTLTQLERLPSGATVAQWLLNGLDAGADDRAAVSAALTFLARAPRTADNHPFLCTHVPVSVLLV